MYWQNINLYFMIQTIRATDVGYKIINYKSFVLTEKILFHLGIRARVSRFWWLEIFCLFNFLFHDSNHQIKIKLMSKPNENERCLAAANINHINDFRLKTTTQIPIICFKWIESAGERILMKNECDQWMFCVGSTAWRFTEQYLSVQLFRSKVKHMRQPKYITDERDSNSRKEQRKKKEDIRIHTSIVNSLVLHTYASFWREIDAQWYAFKSGYFLKASLYFQQKHSQIATLHLFWAEILISWRIALFYIHYYNSFAIQFYWSPKFPCAGVRHSVCIVFGCWCFTVRQNRVKTLIRMKNTHPIWKLWM